MPLGSVIIVDDESIITRPVRRLLRRLFKQESMDYEVYDYQSPEDALGWIAKKEYDVALVISDIMMQPMNGLDFLREIKETHPETLLIVLTGYADQEMFRNLNEQLELYSYYEKPWNDEKLQRTVRNALNLYRRKRLLSRYVPDEVVEKVLMHPDDEILEGVELETTILFLDVRDSTFLLSSDDIGPKKALEYLNTYFEKLLIVLEVYGGILDKFMGDGFMALFGVPVPAAAPADDAQNAVLAAIKMREIVHELNKVQKETPLEIGVGISTGTVIAGNIGSQHRANYTVLGSHVNIAFRLQRAVKPITDGILISQTTYDYVKEVVEVRPYDLLSSKIGEIETYEVLGNKKKIDSLEV